MTKPSSAWVILDTNILVYAVNADAEQHVPAKRILDAVAEGTLAACLTPQILFEYFSAVTHPSVSSQPITPSTALNNIRIFMGLFRILSVPTDIVDRVTTLLEQTRFSGRHVHDIQVAATAIAHGIYRIYTYDRRFGKIPGIIPFAP